MYWWSEQQGEIALTHDGEASAAGHGLDATVCQRLGDDRLHLPTEEPCLLWPDCSWP